MVICRLCLLDQNQHLAIFSYFKPTKNVADIIRKHIGEVDELDPLPKHVCQECWEETYNFHEFYEKVQLSQANYLEESIKCEQESHFIAIDSNVDLESNDIPDEVHDLSNDNHMKLIIKVPNQIDIDAEQKSDENSRIKDEDTFGIDTVQYINESNSVSDDDSAGEYNKTLEQIKTCQFVREYICDCCQCKLLSKKSLLKHLRKHTKFTCQICSERCESKIKLERHHKEIHNKESDDVIIENKRQKHNLSDFFTMRCDIDSCNAQFSSLQTARQHYKSAHNLTGYLTCCNKKFFLLKTIDVHFLWHVNYQLYKCELCDSYFSSRKSHTTHMEKHGEPKQKRVLCPECGKAFFSSTYLNRHIKVHDHSRKKSLQCPECDKRYTTQKTLENHILFAHKNEPKVGEMCEFCGKRFLFRTSVLSHVKMVHQSLSADKQFKCNICSALFINKHRLKTHITSMHQSQPVKCPHCDRISPNDRALNCHIRSVHVERNHQCHLCSKSFKAAVALKDHIATHTGEKMYKCAFCPEAFIWRPNMYAHQKKAHPVEFKQMKSKNPK